MPALPVTLQYRRATRVAYLRHTGPYGASVARFYASDVGPWIERHGWSARERFGIGLDDPIVTDPAQCRYDACVALPDDYQPPRGMLTMTIPAGRHAVLAFKGTVDEIGIAWQRLCHEWLPDNNLQCRSGHGFEHYPPGARHDLVTGVFECGICIPVVPR